MSTIEDAGDPAERTRQLQDVVEQLAATLVVEDIVRVILDRALPVLGASAGRMVLLAPDSRNLDVIGQSVDFSPTSEVRYSIETHLPSGDAVRTGEPVWLRSPGEVSERYPRLALSAGEYRVAAVPLAAEDRPFGALVLHIPAAVDLNLDRQKAIRFVASLTAQAIHRARIIAEERQARARAELLQQVTAGLTSLLTVAEVARFIVIRGQALLGARACAVALVTEDGTSLETVATEGYTPDLTDRWRRFPIDSLLPIGDVVVRGLPVWLPDRAEAFRRYPRLAEFADPASAAWALLPLLTPGHIRGVVSLSFAAPRPIADDERILLETIGEQCARTLDRALIFEAEIRSRVTAENERARLRQLLTAMPGLVVVCDSEAAIVMASPAARDVLGSEALAGYLPRTGVEAFERFGLRRPDGTLYPDDHLPWWRALVRDETVGEEDGLVWNAASDEDLPVLISAAPNRTETGRTEGAILVFQLRRPPRGDTAG